MECLRSPIAICKLRFAPSWLAHSVLLWDPNPEPLHYQKQIEVRIMDGLAKGLRFVARLWCRSASFPDLQPIISHTGPNRK